MGVSYSKRIYEKTIENQGLPDAFKGVDAPVEQHPEEAQTDDKSPEEATTNETNPDAMKTKKWQPFLKDLINIEEVKTKINTTETKNNAKQPTPEENPLFAKNIKENLSTIKEFINASKPAYANDLLLFLTTGLLDKDKQPIKFDETAVKDFSKEEQSSTGIMTMRFDNTKKYAELKEKIDTIITALGKAAVIAKKHMLFRKILEEYIVTTDTFKNIHKAENISGSKDDILKGDETTGQKALDKNKEKEKGNQKAEAEAKGGAEPGGAETGGYNHDNQSISGGSISSFGGSVDSSVDSSDSSFGGSDSSVGGSDSSVGGSVGGSDITVDGGGAKDYLAKRKEIKRGEKEYKDFKKKERSNFAEKTKAFLNDPLKLNEFMDSNETALLQLVYVGKNPLKWHNSDPKIEKDISEKLVNVINAYDPEAAKVKKDGEKGDGNAAGEKGDAAAGDTAAAAAGEKGDAADGNAQPKEPEAVNAPPEVKNAEGVTGSAPPEMSGGSKRKKNVKKKKDVKKKKPQHINININVGDNNAISADISESSSSDSSSSSSDSESTSSESSSSSDSESEPRKKKKKNKRYGKYTINT